MVSIQDTFAFMRISLEPGLKQDKIQGGQSESERSGYSVSLSAGGNIIAIGAPNNDDAGQAAGQVRVYENISGVWTQVGQDINGKVNQFGLGGNSGYSVSLSSDGGILAIGTLIIYLTLISTVVNAQEFNIVGNWKVKEIISPKAVENENILNVINGLRESTLHIKYDKSISITSANPTQGSRFFYFDD